MHANNRNELSRREMLGYTAAAASGLMLGSPLQASAVKPGKAKAVIQIWMGAVHPTSIRLTPSPMLARIIVAPIPHPSKQTWTVFAFANACHCSPNRPINIPSYAV